MEFRRVLFRSHGRQNHRVDGELARSESRSILCFRRDAIQRGDRPHRNYSEISVRRVFRHYGVLKFQRDLSLLGSNLTSAGVLAPIALRTTGSLGLGMTLA